MPGFHDVTAPWFERPTFDDHAPQNISEESKALARRYREDGFLVHDFGFDEELLNGCWAATNEIPEQYTRHQDLWRRNQYVKRLAAHPKVLSFLSALYDRRAFPFQTLNFSRGTQQGTHSDSFHFSCFPERFMCGVWVALEDIDTENGPLHYYPGSHQLPVYTAAHVAESGKPTYEAFVQARLLEQGYQKACGLIKRGEAIIWSANLFHGGDPILDTNRSRFSQVSHYYFENCLYYTPLSSAPFTGKMAFREPYDFSEERFVRSVLNGKVVWPGWDAVCRSRYFHYSKYAPWY